MPKDFAGRGRPPSKKRKPAQSKRRVSPKQRVLFHGPSFSFGSLVGAGIVIVAAYAPAIIDSADITTPQPASSPAQQRPVVEFEFPQLLKDSEIKVDPETYAVAKPDENGQASSFTIQAASFRRKTDAEQLRATLLLQDLPTTTGVSSVDGSTWYRVSVGPFVRRVDAARAMTKLREQGLSALWINNHN